MSLSTWNNTVLDGGEYYGGKKKITKEGELRVSNILIKVVRAVLTEKTKFEQRQKVKSKSCRHLGKLS